MTSDPTKGMVHPDAPRLDALRLEASLRLIADGLVLQNDGFRDSSLARPLLDRALEAAGIVPGHALRKRLSQLLQERHGIRTFRSRGVTVLRSRDAMFRWSSARLSRERTPKEQAHWETLCNRR